MDDLAAGRFEGEMESAGALVAIRPVSPADLDLLAARRIKVKCKKNSLGPLAKFVSSNQRASTSAQYRLSSAIFSNAQPTARCSADSPFSKSMWYLFSRCQRMKVESDARHRHQYTATCPLVPVESRKAGWRRKHLSTSMSAGPIGQRRPH